MVQELIVLKWSKYCCMSTMSYMHFYRNILYYKTKQKTIQVHVMYMSRTLKSLKLLKNENVSISINCKNNMIAFHRRQKGYSPRQHQYQRGHVRNAKNLTWSQRPSGWPSFQEWRRKAVWEVYGESPQRMSGTGWRVREDKRPVPGKQYEGQMPVPLLL